MTRVSAVIPARNEAGAIADVVTAASDIAQEVIVVDDGSTDTTGARARSAGATVVRLPIGRGKGFALRAGVRASAGDVIVMLDGDGQDDPADAVRLLAEIEAGADLVVGTRFGRGSERLPPPAVAPLDQAGNRALTALLNLLFGVALTDTQAGFRAIRRSLWDRLALRSDGFGVETEVVVLSLRAGADVREVAVSRHARVSGQRALRRVRDGLAIVGCMLRLRVRED